MSTLSQSLVELLFILFTELLADIDDSVGCLFSCSDLQFNNLSLGIECVDILLEALELLEFSSSNKSQELLFKFSCTLLLESSQLTAHFSLCWSLFKFVSVLRLKNCISDVLAFEENLADSIEFVFEALEFHPADVSILVLFAWLSSENWIFV